MVCFSRTEFGAADSGSENDCCVSSLCQNDPTISSIILDEEEVKAKELEKEMARKDSVFEDEDQGIGSSDDGEEIGIANLDLKKLTLAFVHIS